MILIKFSRQQFKLPRLGNTEMQDHIKNVALKHGSYNRSPLNPASGIHGLKPTQAIQLLEHPFFFVFDLLIKIANRPNGHWPSSILLTLTTMIGTQFQTLLQNLTQNTQLGVKLGASLNLLLNLHLQTMGQMKLYRIQNYFFSPDCNNI